MRNKTKIQKHPTSTIPNLDQKIEKNRKAVARVVKEFTKMKQATTAKNVEKENIKTEKSLKRKAYPESVKNQREGQDENARTST